MENELSQLTTHVKELESTYGDRDKVLDLLLGSRKERKDLEQAIADAPGLPEGYADWKQFRATYVEHQSRRELLLANKHDLETNVASLEAGLPDESAEEVILELEEATRRYTAVRDEGAALKRILEKTGTLLSDTGDIVTRGLKSSFEAYFSDVTGNRYDESEFENDLPTGVLRADGSILAYHQLSAGTKDGLSLALRLAMAEHFLESRSGFLILDDPLVDMDGERRIAASAAIQRFSENLQTIMFTCHPEHAALFPAPAIIRLD